MSKKSPAVRKGREEDIIDASRCAVVAVDTVIFTIRDGRLNVLLMKLDHGYFKDSWAIPGGIVDIDEDLDDTAKRRLKEKTGLTDVYLEQLYSFGEVRRDPRRRVVTVAYFALVNADNVRLEKAERDAVMWMPVNRLPKLAYDHNQIADYALSRLRSKIEYTNIVYSLLPEKFTLSQLQKVYEIILDEPIDKRNFRRKIISLDLIKETGSQIGVAHRPSKLFSFRSKKMKIVRIF